MFVNHFPMSVSLDSAFHYDVEPTFPERGKAKAAMRKDKELLFRAFEVMKKSLPKVFPKPYAVAYDGLKNAYSTRQLAFDGEGTLTKEVQVAEFEDVPKQVVKVRFVMQPVGPVDLKGAVAEYCRRGGTATRPIEAMSVINIILGKIQVLSLMLQSI